MGAEEPTAATTPPEDNASVERQSPTGTRRRKKLARAAAATSDGETSPAPPQTDLPDDEVPGSGTVAVWGLVPGRGSAVSASAPALCGTLLELHLQQRAAVDALLEVVDLMFFAPLPAGGIDELFFTWLLAQAPAGLLGKKGAPLRYADFATNRPRGEPSSLRRTMCIALKKARPSNSMETIARSDLQLTTRRLAAEKGEPPAAATVVEKKEEKTEEPEATEAGPAAPPAAPAAAPAAAAAAAAAAGEEEEEASMDSAEAAAALLLLEAAVDKGGEDLLLVPEETATSPDNNQQQQQQPQKRQHSLLGEDVAPSSIATAAKRSRISVEANVAIEQWLQEKSADVPPLNKRVENFSRLDFLCSPVVQFAEVTNWTPREIAIFQVALCTYGQDFAEIANCIRTKSYKESYQFYTQTFKQSTRYSSFKFHKKLAAWYAAL